RFPYLDRRARLRRARTSGDDHADRRHGRVRRDFRVATRQQSALQSDVVALGVKPAYPTEHRMNFAGKVAVVTGAASGIGAAVAQGFAARGGTVVVADYNEQGARNQVQRITAAGGRALALRIDVTRAEDIQRMIDTAVATYGRLDLLHNNAYSFRSGPAGVWNISDEAWDHGINIGLTA